MKKKTYHRGFLAGRIGYRDERNIEVVQVHFTLGLKFVEEVEKAECEGGAGASPGRRKPTGAKKLATASGRIHPGITAETVHYPYCVDARDVEQCECYRL